MCVFPFVSSKDIWVGLLLSNGNAKGGTGWQRMVGCLLSVLATCCLPSSVPFTVLSATVHLLPSTCQPPTLPTLCATPCPQVREFMTRELAQQLRSELEAAIKENDCGAWTHTCLYASAGLCAHSATETASQTSRAAAVPLSAFTRPGQSMPVSCTLGCWCSQPVCLHRNL